MKLKRRIKSIWSLISNFRDDRNVPMPARYSDNSKEYLADFRSDKFGGMPNIGMPTSVEVPSNIQTVSVVVNPKDVLKELGRIPTIWSLDGLDTKIKMLKEKRKLIEQKYAADEVDGLILCLENRKKYDHVSRDRLTFREFFSRFDATDQIRVDALCKKHNLVMKSADIFIPEFPDDATQVMADITRKVMELCEKKPRLFVIANEDQFRDANRKRDPILLAQSPFGFYYYILGAWDKEMLYLPDL